MPPSALFSVLIAMIALFVSPAGAKAALLYWNGTSTSWSATGSWSTDPNATTPNPGAVPAASDDVIFGISTLSSAQVTNLNAARSIRSATFNGAYTSSFLGGGAARTWTINAGGLTTQSGAGAITIGSSTATEAVNVTLAAAGASVHNASTLLTFNNLLYLNGAASLKLAGSGGITVNDDFIVGQAASAAGYVFHENGTTTAADRLILGNTTGSYGFYNLSGGTLDVSGASGSLARFRIGAGGGTAGTGIFYMTGGAMTVGTITQGLSLVSSDSTDNGAGPGKGVLYVTGGTITSASLIGVGGKTGEAQLTIDNTAVVTTSSTVAIGGVISSSNNGTGAAIGIVNLNGGTLETTQILKGSGPGTGAKVAYLNFNGGTLRAGADSGTFLQGLDAAYIYSDGATINTNGKNITVAQNLLAPTGDGVSGITVTGTGYSGAPYVAITGGGGTGATAVANIDGNGNLIGITVTNPGTGYTSTPTVTLSGGGGTPGTPSANLAANTGGSLTKTGAGVLTLTGANTYNGGTFVSAGTLLAKNASGSATGTGAVTVQGGVLGGTGIIAPSAGNNVTISSGALSPGADTLTFQFTGSSKLDFASGSFLNLTLGTTSGLVGFSNAGDWLSGSGNVTLNITQGSGFSYDESYKIFENVTTTGFDFAAVNGIGSHMPLLTKVDNDYFLSFEPVPSVASFSVVPQTTEILPGGTFEVSVFVTSTTPVYGFSLFLESDPGDSGFFSVLDSSLAPGFEFLVEPTYPSIITATAVEDFSAQRTGAQLPGGGPYLLTTLTLQASENLSAGVHTLTIPQFSGISNEDFVFTDIEAPVTLTLTVVPEPSPSLLILLAPWLFFVRRCRRFS